MLKSLTRAVALAATIVLATAAAAQTPTQPRTGATSKGPTLVNQKGMTLYVFDGDAAGKSACDNECAQKWPPLTADADAKPLDRWSIIARDDGSKQWAFAGKPLYTWSQDKRPGDIKGDGVADAWHVATACRITTCEDAL